MFHCRPPTLLQYLGMCISIYLFQFFYLDQKNVFSTCQLKKSSSFFLKVGGEKTSYTKQMKKHDI